MARPKGSKGGSKKKHVFQDPQIEEIVDVEIEFICPIRGKVKQKVKMKRLKKVAPNENRTFMGASSLIDDLESKESLSDKEPDPEE